jgi:hypothetical protein
MCGMIPPAEAARRSRSDKLPSTKISLCPSICQRHCRDKRSSGVVANVAERNARTLYRDAELASYNEPKA